MCPHSKSMLVKPCREFLKLETGNFIAGRTMAMNAKECLLSWDFVKMARHLICCSSKMVFTRRKR